jgi:hypothetical protein
MSGRRVSRAVTLPPCDYDPGASVLRAVPVPHSGPGGLVTRLRQDAGQLVPRDWEVREVGARARLRVIAQPVPGDANGRRRRRAIHPLEDLHARGHITRGQCRAGLAVADAWDATQAMGSVDLTAPRVDVSTRPDDRAVALAERARRWAAISRAIPSDARAVVQHVCCDGRYLRDGFVGNARGTAAAVEALVMALAVLADKLGY